MGDSLSLKRRIQELEEKLANVKSQGSRDALKSSASSIAKFSKYPPMSTHLNLTNPKRVKRKSSSHDIIQVVKTKNSTVSSVVNFSENDRMSMASQASLKSRSLKVSKEKKIVAGYHSASTETKQKLTYKRNEQLCSFYIRYGRCRAGSKCLFVHDASKIAVCRKFLIGECMEGNGCPLSHVLDQVKMPVCFHFQKGACFADACPFRHVKVDDKAELCKDFLRGYCPRGLECKELHMYKMDKHSVLSHSKSSHMKMPAGTDHAKAKNVNSAAEHSGAIALLSQNHDDPAALFTSKMRQLKHSTSNISSEKIDGVNSSGNSFEWIRQVPVSGFDEEDDLFLALPSDDIGFENCIEGDGDDAENDADADDDDFSLEPVFELEDNNRVQVDEKSVREEVEHTRDREEELSDEGDDCVRKQKMRHSAGFCQPCGTRSVAFDGAESAHLTSSKLMKRQGKYYVGTSGDDGFDRKDGELNIFRRHYEGVGIALEANGDQVGDDDDAIAGVDDEDEDESSSINDDSDGEVRMSAETRSNISDDSTGAPSRGQLTRKNKNRNISNSAAIDVDVDVDADTDLAVGGEENISDVDDDSVGKAESCDGDEDREREDGDESEEDEVLVFHESISDESCGEDEGKAPVPNVKTRTFSSSYPLVRRRAGRSFSGSPRFTKEDTEKSAVSDSHQEELGMSIQEDDFLNYVPRFLLVEAGWDS